MPNSAELFRHSNLCVYKKIRSDKTGKTGRFGLTGNRNPEYDRPAILTWTSQIHTKILHDIKPSLPALAALNDIEKNRAPASVRPGGVDAKAAEKKIRDWFKK